MPRKIRWSGQELNLGPLDPEARVEIESIIMGKECVLYMQPYDNLQIKSKLLLKYIRNIFLSLKQTWKKAFITNSIPRHLNNMSAFYT